MPILVDTSAIIALLSARDENQERALRMLSVLKERPNEIVIPRIVLFEALGHFTRRGRDKADRNRVLDEFNLLDWRYEDHVATDYQAALEMWRKFADWPLEFPDCLIVVTAKRLSCEAVWTYDANTLGRVLQWDAKTIRVLGLGID